MTHFPSQNRQEEAVSALVLGGFVNSAPAPGGAAAAAPSYGVGAKSALKRPTAAAAAAPVGAAAAAAAAPAAAGTWKLAADGDEDEDALVDEEELLTEEDRARPAPAAAAAGGEDDCEVGKAGRKACKNCTCGRAEAEAAGVKVQLTEEMIQNPGVGSCGNVSKTQRGPRGGGARGGLFISYCSPNSHSLLTQTNRSQHDTHTHSHNTAPLAPRAINSAPSATPSAAPAARTAGCRRLSRASRCSCRATSSWPTREHDAAAALCVDCIPPSPLRDPL